MAATDDDGQLTLKQAIISMSWQFWDDYYPVSGLVRPRVLLHLCRVCVLMYLLPHRR